MVKLSFVPEASNVILPVPVKSVFVMSSVPVKFEPSAFLKLLDDKTVAPSWNFNDEAAFSPFPISISPVDSAMI